MTDSQSQGESKSSVGVITAIDDIDGTRLDAGAIDANKRNEWIDHIEAQLEEISGVETVWGAGNTHLNNQTGQFEITVAHSTLEWRDGVLIDANLRSIGQRIPNIFVDSRFVASHTVTAKPETIANGRHDSPTYIVEFWLR